MPRRRSLRKKTKTYLINVPLYQGTNTNNATNIITNNDPAFTLGHKFRITADYVYNMTKTVAGTSYARFLLANIYAFNYQALAVKSTSVIGNHTWSGSVDFTVTAPKSLAGIQLRTLADLSTVDFTLTNIRVEEIFD